MKKSVVVKMQQDFEAIPIANLVQVANRYESKIYLEHGDSCVNAKSIMGMMSLALLNGESVTIEAEGEDAEMAVAEIERFLTQA